MQGYKNLSIQDRLQQQEILDSYRWEFALINLVTLWAILMEFSSVSIDPEEKDDLNKMNKVTASNPGKNRASMRYLVSPSRVGFRPDPPRTSVPILYL